MSRRDQFPFFFDADVDADFAGATEPVVFATLEEIARAGARRALQQAIETRWTSTSMPTSIIATGTVIGWWSAMSVSRRGRS
ncbi:MAG: hypothetical protein ACREIT_01870 [Tepidisphaeraceae bacterium]